MWQGEGPVHGLLSYFGGLYPMALGWGSRALGVSFDSLLSVVSWPMVLALPLALLWLGRKLWPGRALEPAVFVFLGTVGSSLALDDHAEWVYSLLPSGANIWPTYPRDIAFVLLVVALAIVVGSDSRRANVLAGLVAGVSICVHAQLGVYAVAIVIAYRLWQAFPTRAFRRWIEDAAIVGVVALGVSAWWWWPRLHIVLDTRRSSSRATPGSRTPTRRFAGLVGALGVVGLLAIPGVVLALRHGGQAERFAAVWLLVFAPIGLVGALVGDVGVVTGRRIFFLAALPIVICAADAATALVRRGPVAVVVPLLLLAIVIPSTAEAKQTRDLVSLRWVNSPVDAGWQRTYDQLRSRVLVRGHETVIAPDADGIRLWEHTGAQPFSFWPTGATKLGFDLGQVTPYSYKDRVRMQDDAAAKGLPGICALAAPCRREVAGALQRRHAPRYPRHPPGGALPGRSGGPDPGDAPAQGGARHHLRRPERDRQPGAHEGRRARARLGRARCRARRSAPPQVGQRDREPSCWSSRTAPSSRRSPTRISVVMFATPGGITPGTRIVFRKPTTVTRVMGFEPVPGFTSTTRGPTLFARDAIC